MAMEALNPFALLSFSLPFFLLPVSLKESADGKITHTHRKWNKEVPAKSECHRIPVHLQCLMSIMGKAEKAYLHPSKSTNWNKSPYDSSFLSLMRKGSMRSFPNTMKTMDGEETGECFDEYQCPIHGVYSLWVC
jgi:hypothetical protein